MRGKFSSAKITDCQFSNPSELSRGCQETVIINSLNGTKHVFFLDMSEDNTDQIIFPEKPGIVANGLPPVLPLFA